jgi:hypothetical protein
MGQRSQIYVKITEENEVILLANYYQYNYGESMISRAKSGIEHIKYYLDTYAHNIICYNKSTKEKLRRYFDVDFDKKDTTTSIDIIKDYEDCKEKYNLGEFNSYVFSEQDNNDGKLFIDVDYNTKTIKYCFTNRTMTRIMRAREYFNWDMKDNCLKNYEIEEVTENNIKFLNKNTKLMTKEELQNFITTDYGYNKEEVPLF